MHQNEWFQAWFFKNFLGRGSPRTPPPAFSRASPSVRLRPQFSGNSRPRLGLCPRYSGASRPQFGLCQLSIADLGLAPPKINSWIRPCGVAESVTAKTVLFLEDDRSVLGSGLKVEHLGKILRFFRRDRFESQNLQELILTVIFVSRREASAV